MHGSPTSREIFTSYSRSDKKWMHEISVFLHPLERYLRLTFWNDQEISPGRTWHPEITGALNRADGWLLLVTPSFLASPFIMDVELPQILKLAKESGRRAYWLPLLPCLYDLTPLADIQAISEPGRPLALLPKPQRAKELERIAQVLRRDFELPRNGVSP